MASRFSSRSVPPGSAGMVMPGCLSNARAYTCNDQGLPLCATYTEGCLGEAWPLPVESTQVARVLSRLKVSLTLLPKVVVPEMVQAVGRPSGPKVMVSAMVGPRPLFLTL